jgi:ribulose kinase
MMAKYVIGIDFGTDSVRSVVLNAMNGEEQSASVAYYPRWKDGLYCHAARNMFRQHPLDPLLDGFTQRLYARTYTADEPPGIISPEWGARLGLPANVLIGTGAFDCHMGAAGGQIERYFLSRIMGTSTCDILGAPLDEGKVNCAPLLVRRPIQAEKNKGDYEYETGLNLVHSFNEIDLAF